MSSRLEHLQQKRARSLPVTFRHPTSVDQDLAIAFHQVLERFRTGSAKPKDLREIASRVMLGIALVRSVFPECRDVMLGAYDATQRIRRRLMETGQYGISGDDFRALGAALNLVDDMHSLCTRRELLSASREARVLVDMVEAASTAAFRGPSAH